MKIVIVGGGSVGTAICSQLDKEGHDITVVDIHADALEEIVNICDVATVQGNGATVSVLEKAGVSSADLVIAVTPGDEVNILCCAAAKHLGTKHTIARVRNPEYTDLMQMMKGEMNLSLTINPELAAAKELYRMLRFPAAAKIETFCRGRVEVAEFVIEKDSPICGATLLDLRARLKVNFLVCGVQRNGEAYIPSGRFRLEAGDTVCVTAPDEDITRFFKAIGAYKEPLRNVLIAGGGRVTYYLETLLHRGHIASKVIESDKGKCRELAEQDLCQVISGNATKQELLLQEGLGSTDAFLALTDNDEENAISSMYAKTVGVTKVITMIRTMSYVNFFSGVGLESIVSPKSSAATFILRYVRSMANIPDSEIEALHHLMDGRVEAVEFTIKEEIEGLTGIPLKAIHNRHGVLIACIVHNDKILIPTGDDRIENGDTVIVITESGNLHSIKDIIK